MVVVRGEEVITGVRIGAPVYTRGGTFAGNVAEVAGRCIRVTLEDGPTVWLGRQMVEAVTSAGIILASNLLRKTASVHDGIHLHDEPGRA